jgi:hypothetical protein
MGRTYTLTVKQSATEQRTTHLLAAGGAATQYATVGHSATVETAAVR